MEKTKQQINRTIKFVKNPVVAYESIWLRVMVAFLVAQMIVHILRQRHGLDSYLDWTFHRTWLITFGIAFAIMQWAYLLTVYLDHKVPWDRATKKRRQKQILYGVGIPVLFDFIAMTIYFGYFGYNIFYTGWPTLYLPITLFMLGLLNFYYYNKYKVFEKKQEKARRTKERELKTLAQKTVEKEVTETERIWLYSKEDKQVWGTFNNGRKIITLLKSLTEIDLTNEWMTPNRFYRVAWENILTVKKVDRQFLIILKIPKDYEIMVSKRMSILYRDILNKMS
ncbi:hypothetical protein ACXZ1K_02250 [Pedobacter sp. PWIIR3]